MTNRNKLMHIQTEIKAPKNLYNSFGNYKYRNAEGICEAVKPFLEKENCSLTLSDSIVEVGGRVYVKAHAVLSDCEDGSIIGETEAYAREAEAKKGMDDSQVTGAASSYARKYALNGLFLLDDTKDADSDEYHEQTNKKDEQKQTNNAEKKSSKKGSQPEMSEDEMKAMGKAKISDVKVKSLQKRCEDEGVSVDTIKTLYKVSDFSKLSEIQFLNIHENWEKIKAL